MCLFRPDLVLGPPALRQLRFEAPPGLPAHGPRTDRAGRDQCERDDRHAPDKTPHRREHTVSRQLHHQHPGGTADHRCPREGGATTGSGVLDETLPAPDVHGRAVHAHGEIGPHVTADVADQQRRVRADQRREPLCRLRGRLDAAPVDDIRRRRAADRHGGDDREDKRVADPAQWAECGTGVRHGSRQGLRSRRTQWGHRAAHGQQTLTGSIPKFDRCVERVPCCEAE